MAVKSTSRVSNNVPIIDTEEYSDDEIQHTEFEKCYLKGDLNSFWKKIFLEMSKGIAPKGTKLSNKGYFVCNVPKKEFNLNFRSYFENHNLGKFINKIISLFNSNLGIYDATFESKSLATTFKDSSNGISSSHQVKTYASGATSKIQTWSELRTKNNKDEGILSFVIDMKKIYGLSEETSKRLFSDLTMLEMLKIIGLDNITYSNGKVENVDCVEFKKEEYKITYPEKTMNLKYSSVREEETQVYFSMIWDESKFVI
jgi:hypothetical protein